MDKHNEKVSDLEEPLSSEGSFVSTAAGLCCGEDRDRYRKIEDEAHQEAVQLTEVTASVKSKQSPSELSGEHSYATSKNVAEGLMDIALLSANANQLRFLITYNHEASTFYYSLVLVILSLVLQIFVGIVLIFKRRIKPRYGSRYVRTNEVLVMGVFFITVINVLLAAFTTTDKQTT